MKKKTGDKRKGKKEEMKMEMDYIYKCIPILFSLQILQNALENLHFTLDWIWTILSAQWVPRKLQIFLKNPTENDENKQANKQMKKMKYNALLFFLF